MWARVLATGFLAWTATTAAVVITSDTTLIASVILIGSFLMPVTFLTWVFERQGLTSRRRPGVPTALTTARVTTGFAISGLFAVSVAATAETLLLERFPLVFYGGVALTEELVKLLVIILVGRSLAYYTRRDGMVLGAAVGFGFAAFESAGYAFNTIVKHGGVDLSLILQTEAVRALLIPVGHGLWTALVGGALFVAAANHQNRFRITWAVVGWYFVAVLLHAWWDLSAGFSVALTYLVTHQPISIAAVERGQLMDPTRSQAALDGVFDWVLLGICAAVGLWIAHGQWRRGAAEAQSVPNSTATQVP